MGRQIIVELWQIKENIERPKTLDEITRVIFGINTKNYKKAVRRAIYSGAYSSKTFPNGKILLSNNIMVTTFDGDKYYNVPKIDKNIIILR